jgi:hypothetical protein
MSATDRQNRLLLAEDWKRIYTSFKYADFKSYDFDNLRRVMINYIRENYPEDFNDYIESSEYLALIDLIAFLGQNIAFRTDLNARENFIELAERRESVLRLARLLSYNPKRNQPANGLLKFNSVSTSENIVDNNGRSLANKTVVWNDNTNPEWFEQFIKIINSALSSINQFGNPVQFSNVSGIPTEQYKLASTAKIPVYTFTKSVNNRSLTFEVVSTGLTDQEIIEETPNALNQLGFLYRDNGQGPASSSTGFFLHFRQGDLQRIDFNIDTPVPNEKIDIDTPNINNSDIWLYRLDDNNNEVELWTKVDAVEGNNIVFNSLNKNIRKIYSVITRVEDRISLVFSDGVFGELPRGRYRLYYRVSANRNYTILPGSLSNINIKVPYVSKIGRVENLSITASLRTAVDNASASESTESIKNNAPSTYYTQNRLITGEDYNIGPLSISQDIIKTKSVNRTASGISRYFDILDATGKYSQTNLFGTDGIIYREFDDKKIEFKFATRTDIEQIIENQITNAIQDKTVRNFYLSEFPNQDYSEFNIEWTQTTEDTNRSTGLLKDQTTDVKYPVSSFTAGPLRFFEPGSLVKFISPVGKVFNSKNEIVDDNNSLGTKNYIWTKVISVSGDGTEIANGLGPIILNEIVPNGAILSQAKPKFNREISQTVKNQIIDQMFSYKTFGLRYDVQTRSWRVILDDNLNVFSSFSLAQTGDTSNQQLDSSWIMLFETNGISYTATYRSLRYVFESDKDIRFFFDGNQKIYDSKTGKIIRDTIKVLSVNSKPNQPEPFTRDFVWEIFKEFKDPAGYVDSKKLEVAFFDSDEDGIVDDPDIFNQIVNAENLIFTKKTIKNNSEFEIYVDQDAENILIFQPGPPLPSDSDNGIIREKSFTNLDDGTIIYNVLPDTFERVDRSVDFIPIFDYKAYKGRDKLKFQYLHASSENRRIDPSSTNIIDTYILTRQYDTQFRLFLNGSLLEKPLPSSSDSLFQSYGKEINKIKSISDEIIYHSVKYKLLFGKTSDLEMQAKFKIVKNSNQVISDNEIKSRVISSINKYFALDNWDFGETFYFSELSAFVMKDQAPFISSIVIVPVSATSNFGSLFEIKSEADEIFISSATVDDVEIISANTADRLKTQGAIVSTSQTLNVGIQSANGTQSNSTNGGFTF